MIYRIDVAPAGTEPGAAGADPLGHAVQQQILEYGTDVGAVSTRRIFLIDTDAPEDQVRRIADALLADPVVETASIWKGSPAADSAESRIEIHLKPGVMDPVAASTEMAIGDLGIAVRQVRTGRAYLLDRAIDREQLQRIASRVLANGVIESIHFEPFVPERFAEGGEYRLHLKHVRLRELSDDQLTRLSREGHLFLSLAEMQAIQAYYREAGREPTDIELETFAQTWSEHCVHKTLKAAVEVEVRSASGNVIANRRYGNLIKETIFRATTELMQTNPGFCLSVFADNAGVIAFDDTDALCFKVETHNHPSAIEPYGGAATGIGGVIRDILGTGLAAKPIANTDVFCVAYPDAGAKTENRRSKVDSLPRGVIHPKRVLQQVVAGVRDYGNRMGIPTVNGAVYFDDRYLGNPLVFCGCVGLIPRDKIAKAANAGDAIVVMGGRTGRDGIHGATFSSAELTDTHADEFSHAVQIGNAITEKKVTDVILQARDRGLFTAVTDCGAGGLSSAVGEMGEKIGALVELERAPLKYPGLRYDEIWISEAQERMVLSVPSRHVQAMLELAAAENVEATVIGQFGTEGADLILRYEQTEVGRLPMRLLHDGIPMPTRKAIIEVASAPRTASAIGPSSPSVDPQRRLLEALGHPNVASKHWIIRQYDHEVQGASVIKPLVGPIQIGPSDAAVIRPKLDSFRGAVLSAGLAPQVDNPYFMAIAAIDEAVRNAVAVGADPNRLAVLDNFCWPSVDDARTMGTLVRACEACYDASKAYQIPFISGKDSLHNQFTNQETGEILRIPNTLLISAIGVIDDVRKCLTLDLKDAKHGRLCLIAPAANDAALKDLAQLHRAVAEAISMDLVISCHDVSDGGWLTAAAEMALAGGLGLKLVAPEDAEPDSFFAESNGRYLVEVPESRIQCLSDQLTARGARLTLLGEVVAEPRFTLAVGSEGSGGPVGSGAGDHREVDVSLEQLTRAWRDTLDW